MAGGQNQPNCVEKKTFLRTFFFNLIEMDGQNQVMIFISVQE